MMKHKAKYWHWTQSNENLQLLSPAELYMFQLLVDLQP